MVSGPIMLVPCLNRQAELLVLVIHWEQEKNANFCQSARNIEIYAFKYPILKWVIFFLLLKMLFPYQKKVTVENENTRD